MNKVNKTRIFFPLLFFIVLTTFSCKNNTQEDKKWNKVNDTLTLMEVENYIDTIKSTTLKDKKMYLDFYFGQPKDSVIALQKSYIKKGVIYKESVRYDSVPHYFSTISLNTFNLETHSNLKIKADVRFNFENDKLESMLLSLFSPKNYVPRELKKTVVVRSLKELEDNLIGNKNNIDFESEMQEEKENINNISFIYIKSIHEDISEMFTSKYENSIKIKDVDKNNQLKQLWLFEGKYIEFDFAKINNISKNYYDNLDDDIFIGSIFYSTILNVAKTNRTANKVNANSVKNKIDSNQIKRRINAELNGL